MIDSSPVRGAVRRWIVLELAVLLLIYVVAAVRTVQAILAPVANPDAFSWLLSRYPFAMAGVVLAAAFGMHMFGRQLAFPWLRRLVWRRPIERLRLNVLMDSYSRRTMVHTWTDPYPGLIALVRENLVLCDASTAHYHINLKTDNIDAVEYDLTGTRPKLILDYSHPGVVRASAATVPFDNESSAMVWADAIAALSGKTIRTGQTQ